MAESIDCCVARPQPGAAIPSAYSKTKISASVFPVARGPSSLARPVLLSVDSSNGNDVTGTHDGAALLGQESIVANVANAEACVTSNCAGSGTAPCSAASDRTGSAFKNG